MIIKLIIFFHHLDIINDEYNLDLNMDNWNDEKEYFLTMDLPLGEANDQKKFWNSLNDRI